MTASDLIGSWEFAGTEIPHPYVLGVEFYHFSPDGYHYVEYPLLKQPMRVFRWRYEVTETGVRLSTSMGVYYRDLALRLEDQFLVLTGTHGWSSWLRRIQAFARPSFLTRFFECPAAC
jgi:hypothetical protein